MRERRFVTVWVAGAWALVLFAMSGCGVGGGGTGGWAATDSDAEAALDGGTTGGGGATDSDAGAAVDGDARPDAPPAACTFSECAANTARTCDGEVTLACDVVGGSCESFVDVDGLAFGWCDCGGLAPGRGRCLDPQRAVLCEDGLALPSECGAGTVCDLAPDAPEGIACYCDDVNDGLCPSPDCVYDPDCASCTPACDGRTCGSDGCGGQCGACGAGTSCVDGRCEAPSAGAVTVCNDRCPFFADNGACEDGVGGASSLCLLGTDCSDCGPRACTPRCGPGTAGECGGPDGCGGVCFRDFSCNACEVAGACRRTGGLTTTVDGEPVRGMVDWDAFQEGSTCAPARDLAPGAAPGEPCSQVTDCAEVACACCWSEYYARACIQGVCSEHACRLAARASEGPSFTPICD